MFNKNKCPTCGSKLVRLYNENFCENCYNNEKIKKRNEFNGDSISQPALSNQIYATGIACSGLMVSGNYPSGNYPAVCSGILHFNNSHYAIQ
jgi:hypothetical protein